MLPEAVESVQKFKQDNCTTLDQGRVLDWISVQMPIAACALGMKKWLKKTIGMNIKSYISNEKSLKQAPARRNHCVIITTSMANQDTLGISKERKSNDQFDQLFECAGQMTTIPSAQTFPEDLAGTRSHPNMPSTCPSTSSASSHSLHRLRVVTTKD